MARSKTGAGLGWRESAFAVAAAALLACLAATACGRRPAAPRPRRQRPRRRRSPTGTPGHRRPSAGTLSLVSAKTSPRKSFYYGVRYPQPALRDRQRPAAERPPHRRRRRGRRSRRAASTATTSRPKSPTAIRWDGTTRRRAPGAATAATRFRIVPQSGDRAPLRAAASPRLRRAAAQPRLRPLRLRLPDPRRPRLRRRRRPLRRRPLRPHPRGPGRDGRLRHAAGRRPRRHASSTPATRAPPATTSSSTARAPATTWPTCTCRTLAAAGPGRRSAPASRSAIVGETGDATACHLHFEIWTAPGWYEGGSPIDPLPYLEKWDRYS